MRTYKVTILCGVRSVKYTDIPISVDLEATLAGAIFKYSVI